MLTVERQKALHNFEDLRAPDGRAKGRNFNLRVRMSSQLAYNGVVISTNQFKLVLAAPFPQ